MRAIDCTIYYRLTNPSGEPSPQRCDRKQIDYQIQVEEATTEEGIERGIIAGGMAEIGVVEGSTASYEVLDARALGLISPPSALWG